MPSVAFLTSAFASFEENALDGKFRIESPVQIPQMLLLPHVLGITGGSRNLQPHLAVVFLNYSENKH